MRRLTAILACIAVAVGGCAATPTAVPSGLTVSVFQNRFDYSLRQLEIKVSNQTDSAITVTSAALHSTRFASPAAFDRPQQVPSGGARDLMVQLTEPVCDDSSPVDAVIIDFTLADGSTGTASLTPTDETGRLDAISAEDCLGVSVSRVAQIEAADEVVWTPGAHSPAQLDLFIRPTGAEGSVTVVFAKGTVLLSLVDATGQVGYDVPVDLVASADTADAVIPLTIVPARCDPHAVAEDKRGTFFPLEVETSDAHSGRIYVSVSDAVRASLYAFFGDYCGLP